MFVPIPTSSMEGGRVQCVSFYGEMYRLAKTVGKCSRMEMYKRELTVRRGHGTRGRVEGIDVVRFSRG